MKLFEKHDSKFVDATRSATERAIMIRQLSIGRFVFFLAMALASISFLLAALTRTPPGAGSYFLLLFSMIMTMNADQQIKMLKCFDAEKR